MSRLLSPNEAKFWLLDAVSPMNSIAVIRRAGGFAGTVPAGAAFAVPVVVPDGHRRPRWSRPEGPGTVRRETADDDTAWLRAAEALLDAPTGTAGHPPWRALVLDGPEASTLLLAVNHALTDWRTSLLVADAFLAGDDPGPLAPACEEMLPPESFGDPEADDLLEEWWLERAGARWEALGIERLTSVLPPPSRTRLALEHLGAEDGERLRRRCTDEGATLNGAVAIALRDVAGIDAVAHSIDMARFIKPAPKPGPGLAVSHVFTALSPGAFWDAARDNRALLFEQIRSGAAGDALLSLPKFLLRPRDRPTYAPAAMTITGAPTFGSRAAGPGAPAGDAMRLVLSSARGGGGAVILSFDGDRLQLIAGSPEAGPDVPLKAIAERLREAAR